MQLDELYDYKNLMMKSFCTDEKIVKYVTGKDDAAVPNHGLPYSQIYPFEYIPETVSEGKTFICFDVDIVSAPNKTFYVPVLYVWIFTHKSRLRSQDGGILLDKLSASVNELMNGSRYFGLGELRLDSVRRFTPITDYLGRVLTYYAKDFNRPTGRLDIPSNRKAGK